MPTRYPGRLITANRPTVSTTTTGSGMFTGTEATQYIQTGLWAGLPDVVRNPTITTSVVSQQVSISFSIPTSDGGSAITGYRVVASPGNIVATGTSSPITVTGLINDLAYTFTISAVNNNGIGAGTTVFGTPSLPITSSIDYLIVAGGGGAYGANGGRQENGGAGAGGLLQGTNLSVTGGTTYTITVGSGGTNGTSWTNGSNSTAFSLTAIGGGKGGQRRTGVVGGSGGSGGGGGAEIANGGSGTAGPPRQGYNGGNGTTGSFVVGGGGGGAGAAGANGTGGFGATGGVGVQSSITGTATYYAGGGSTAWSPPLAGGQGGGGASQSGTTGSDGGINTGGGGGTNDGAGGAGGSGVVIVRYPDSFRVATVTGSPTYTVSGGFRVYQFTGNGSIIF